MTIIITSRNDNKMAIATVALTSSDSVLVYVSGWLNRVLLTLRKPCEDHNMNADNNDFINSTIMSCS